MGPSGDSILQCPVSSAITHRTIHQKQLESILTVSLPEETTFQEKQAGDQQQ